MKKIWILGAGKFGQRALENILRYRPEVEITLVDNEKGEAGSRGVTFYYEEGISWLVKNLGRDGDDAPDMIIPAIPVHMVSEWLKKKSLGKTEVRSVPFPQNLVTRMAHPVQNGNSQVFVSHADFICPDNCDEPELFCSYTGKKRGTDMFRLLENLSDTCCIPLVVRSYQLFPGVGGIYPADMWSLWDKVHNLIGKKHLLVATACRCHGVVDCLQVG